MVVKASFLVCSATVLLLFFVVSLLSFFVLLYVLPPETPDLVIDCSRNNHDQRHLKLCQPSNKPNSLSYGIVDDLLTPEIQSELQSMFETLIFPTVQSNWTSNYYNSIGEAEPLNNVTNECNNDYLVYNPVTKECLLPVRMDVAAHYIKSGGFSGYKESYESLISRLLYFVDYHFEFNRNNNDGDNTNQEDDIYTLKKKTLLKLVDYYNKNQKFLTLLPSVCGNGNKKKANYFRPFQMNLLLQLPHQMLPFHFDVPFFDGATRHIFPKWLLTVMDQSNIQIFNQNRIPQIQIVSYIHNDKDYTNTADVCVADRNTKTGGCESDDNDGNTSDKHNNYNYNYSYTKGGEFLLYDRSVKPTKVLKFPPYARSGVFVDGSVAIHGTNEWYPSYDFKHREKIQDYKKPISINKDDKVDVRFDKEEQKWVVYVNDEIMDEGYKFGWDEVRASVVFREWCFENEQDMNEYDPYLLKSKNDQGNELGVGDLDDILNVLKKDLSEKLDIDVNVIENKWDAIKLATKMIEYYVKYPYSSFSIMPYNYCAIFKLFKRQKRISGVFAWVQNTIGCA